MTISDMEQGGFGPYLGEYYDRAARPVPYRPVVAWRGEEPFSRPSVSDVTRMFRFADGSWANPVTGEFYDASGNGDLIAASGVGADDAAVALFGRGPVTGNEANRELKPTWDVFEPSATPCSSSR